MEKWDKNWIKTGMEVCHVDNIEQKMEISHAVRQGRFDVNGDSLGSRLIGWSCSWFVEGKDGKKYFKKGLFHSNRLLPYEVVVMGKSAIKKFYEDINS